MLAEKLWSDGKYAAAVQEFEKVAGKDPKGKLGMMALSRAAHTQAYFLSNYGDALRKFRQLAALGSDPAVVWDAQKQIGDILYTKLERHEEAIEHYRALLKQDPASPEAPEFLFRVAKSHYFLWQFDPAVEAFHELVKTFPESPWAVRASYETGMTLLTKGSRSGSTRAQEPLQEAIRAFESFIKTHPKSEWVSQARFGIASCLEEMDQLDAAYQAYEELKSTFPSPNVIQIKLIRIRERKAQRNR